MKIAAFQSSTLPMSDAKLDYYFRICKEQDVKLLLLGEYILNSFFKELETMPISMIETQSSHKIEALKSLCTKYDITAIAPIVQIKKNKAYKCVAKFSPKNIIFHEQHFLINFRHWDEEKFYANAKKDYKLPSFSLGGIKFGIISGFELHFELPFLEANKKNIDVVLTPTSCTFDSVDRWNNLLSMRAFTSTSYILRANRIGRYNHGQFSWDFYGMSNLWLPDGSEGLSLGGNEELLIANVSKSELNEVRKIWNFRGHFKKRTKDDKLLP